MRRLLALFFLSLPMCAQTTLVSGNVKSLGAAAISGTVKVRYALQNCGGNQPTVSGVVVSVAPVDIPVNASTGAFSGSVYANKDAGVGTNALSCGGTQSSYYIQTLVINGVSQASTATQVLLYNGSTFDPSSAPLCVAGTPISCKLTGMVTSPVLAGTGYTQSTICHQNSASVSWACAHNFGDPAVEVQVTDLNSHVIIPDSITLTDSNTVTIGFTVAQAGQAVIMRAGTLTVAYGLQNVIVANPTTNQTIVGGYSLNVGGPLSATSSTFSQVNTARIVSPSNTQGWAGSDVGAWINSASASCPTATYVGATGTLTGQSCEIYLTAGSFSLTTPIRYVNGLLIHGGGMGPTLITAAAGLNSSMVLMGVNAAENGLPASVLGFMELSGLAFDGNAANQSGTSYCVHMGKAGRVSIHDIQYQNCRNGGIVWDNGNNSAQGAITTNGSDGLGVVVIDHVFGLGPQTGGSNSDGIFDWGGNDFRITRNDYNALNASGNRYGVWLRDSGNVSLENSWVSTATNFGVYVENSSKVRITSSFIDGGSVQGLFVGDSNVFSSQVSATGNTITNAKSAVPQIEVNGCIGCRFTGNVAAGGSGTYGLLIDNIANNSDITESQNVFNGNATGTLSDAGNRLIISNPYGSSNRVNRVDQTAQGGNITNTVIFNTNAAIPGFYRVSCYTVVTRAPSTSATLPNCQVNYTDADSGVAQTVSITNNPSGTPLTLGTTGLLAGQYYGHAVIHAAATTSIGYATVNYASVGATSMQYAIHVQVEYLGN